MPSKAGDGSDAFQKARDRYRETARWVLTALGAAAVATIAGFGLADFGKLDPQDDPLRFSIAALGVAAAVAGFLVALFQALKLASVGWTNATDLTAQPRNDPSDEAWASVNTVANGALAGYPDFPSLSSAHTHALARWREEADRVAAGDLTARETEARWRQRAWELAEAVRQATEIGATIKLRQDFKCRTGLLLFAGALSAVGIVAFAWAVTSPDPDPEVEFIGPLPTVETLEVAEGARAELEEVLGAECNLEEVAVVVTDPGDGEAPKVLVNDADCNPVELTVSEEVGSLTGDSD